MPVFSQKQKKRLILIGAYLAALLLIFTVINLDQINEWINGLILVLRPVLIGLVLAYLCNPIFRMFERKCFVKLSSRAWRRFLSLLCTYIVLFLIFAVLVMLIVPQLLDSILSFLNNYESYLQNTVQNINGLIEWLNTLLSDSRAGTTIPTLDAVAIQTAITDLLNSINLDIATMIRVLTPDNLVALFTIASNTFSIVTDTIFGLFISLYLLNRKEKRYAQIMRLRRALFSDKVNAVITKVCSTADRSFGGFLRGKILDSTIVGILVYIIISLMNVPYAILIAVLIGITDIVPVIGPFVGVIPSAIIILLTDPTKVIPFLLCILVVQQIDGNIIAPKILGENTGVSSLCVLIAITLMGAIWGLVGMVLGVPLFATVLELADGYFNQRLIKKGLPIESERGLDPTEKKDAAPQKQNHKNKYVNAAQFDGCGTLTDREKTLLYAYAAAERHGILTHPSDEAFSAFSAELQNTAHCAENDEATAPAEESISEESSDQTANTN